MRYSLALCSQCNLAFRGDLKNHEVMQDKSLPHYTNFPLFLQGGTQSAYKFHSGRCHALEVQ